jgi:hypothetical protein
MKWQFEAWTGPLFAMLALLPVTPLACSSSSSGGAAPGPGTGSGNGGTDAARGPDGEDTPESGATGDDVGSMADAASGGGNDAASKPAHDGGSADASTASGCAGSTALLCEDFETGHLNTTTWQSSTQEGTVTVDTTHAHSGTYALHVHSNSDSGAVATVTETKTFPAGAGHFFGRAMIWMADPSPMVHAIYISANDQAQDTSYTLASQYQTVLAGAYFNNAEAGDHSAAALPTGAWACYEWEFDGTDGTANYWLNSAELTDVEETGWGKTKFASLDVGISIYGSNPADPSAFDLWYDDIVIATSRVGCP